MVDIISRIRFGGFTVKLIIQDLSIELENEHKSIHEITNIVNERLKHEDGMYFSHFVVDGEEVYEDLELYFEERIKDIKEATAVMKPISLFVSELLASGYEYLERALPEIHTLTSELYSGKLNETKNKLSQFIEGLEWIYQLISTIDRLDAERPQIWDEVLVKSVSLESVFRNLEEAMRNENEIELADFIQYEITPVLEDIKIDIKKIMNEEDK